jgi:hypothetical protein
MGFLVITLNCNVTIVGECLESPNSCSAIFVALFELGFS